MTLNNTLQYYRGLPLRLQTGYNYNTRRSKIYSVNDTSHTIMIPDKYTMDNGTIKTDINFMWLFKKDGRIQAINKAGYKFDYTKGKY